MNIIESMWEQVVADPIHMFPRALGTPHYSCLPTHRENVAAPLTDNHIMNKDEQLVDSFQEL